MDNGFLIAANADMKIVRDLATFGIETHPEGIAFHSQQAAEKMIKAMIASNSHVPPKTHFIDELLYIAQKQGWVNIDEKEIDAAMSLSRHAVDTRYALLPDINKGEALKAICDCNILADMLDRNGYASVHIPIKTEMLHDQATESTSTTQKKPKTIDIPPAKTQASMRTTLEQDAALFVAPTKRQS